MKRKTLIIGGGGREAATVWMIKDSLGPNVEIHCAPGNAGMKPMAELWNVRANDIDGLCALAKKLQPDIVIPGPEEPLVLGISDRLSDLGIACGGPGAEAARLEGSKVFAKRFMRRHNIRTAAFRVFDDPKEARRFDRWPCAPSRLPVIKADGLCGGKGVFIPNDHNEALDAIEEIMVKKKFGVAGDRIVIEELLSGYECSFIVFTDGRYAVPFLPTTDYKRRRDGDEGLNTGGMGAYCPNPLITPNLHEEIMEDIVLPTIRGMAFEGIPYRGFLYFGLMIAEDGIYVLEYNVRMGDPEAAAILPLCDFDLVELLIAAIDGPANEILRNIKLNWRKNTAAVTVVLADEKYPEGRSDGETIAGIEKAKKRGALVFTAGVSSPSAGGQTLVTSGGRILDVTGIGKDFCEAQKIAYAGAEAIQFKGKNYRKDIAEHLALLHQQVD